MALVVMIPFDTVNRIVDRAESSVPADANLSDILPLLKKQTTQAMIGNHYPIALDRDDWAVLIGWCYTVRLHEDADIVVGAVAIASGPEEPGLT